MLNKKFLKVRELSKQIKDIFNAFDISANDAAPLELAAQLLDRRDNEIKVIFSLENQQQLINCQELVEQFLDCDRELQQVSATLKSRMRKLIVQQKRKTKATKAYIQK